VVVRINDRGPIVPGRIIDLSYNTARVLHFESKGLQRVRLDVVKASKKTTQPQMMASLQY
jgi:rare lipoprotein A